MTAQDLSANPPLPKALSLVDRRILVTGAASSIGRATAHAATQLGARLLLNNRASLESIRAELEATGVDVETLEGDLTDAGLIDQLVMQDPIDGLAHCAGILSRVPIELGLALTERMAARGGGAMVMIGSVAGRTGGTSLSTPLDYAASKAALHTVVRWLSRRAIGRGMLINGIAPGPIETAMTAGNTVEPAALPIGRKGRPEEISWMTMILLTPAASYVSGTIVDCNGGAFVG